MLQSFKHLLKAKFLQVVLKLLHLMLSSKLFNFFWTNWTNPRGQVDSLVNFHVNIFDTCTLFLWLVAKNLCNKHFHHYSICFINCKQLEYPHHLMIACIFTFTILKSFFFYQWEHVQIQWCSLVFLMVVSHILYNILFQH